MAESLPFSTPSALPVSFWGFSRAQELWGAQSMLTPHPSCSGLVMGKDRPRSFKLQQHWPHRAHWKHSMSSSGGSGLRLSLCRTPEPANARKNTSHMGTLGWERGIAGGAGRREKGRKLRAYSTARIQPSCAIKETLHRPSKWQKALVVCPGCDLQLPNSTAWLRRQMELIHDHSSPLTDPFRKGLEKQAHNGSSCTLSALLCFPLVITAPEHPQY